MSILADFYNLELGENLKKDEPKILEFFKEYAPNVVRYTTSTETNEHIEAEKKQSEFQDITDTLGTLGMYELQHKKAWVDSEGGTQFYNDYQQAQELVDAYLDKQTIPEASAFWLKKLKESLGKRLVIFNLENSTWVLIEASKWDGIDFSKNTILDMYTGCRWIINAQEAIQQLYDDILEFFQNRSRSHPPLCRCAASDCNKVFSPSPQGSEQKYCSERCRNRIAQRKLRSQKKITPFQKKALTTSL